jgi:hypothetical protein
MKTSLFNHSVPGLLCLILLQFGNLLSLLAQPAAFTYQGRLDDGANPASGIYDLRFAIYDAAGGGTQQGNTLTNTATAVSNGLFTVTLDFGTGVFDGGLRWLEIGVRTNGVGGINLWDIAAGGNNNVLNFFYGPASNDRMTLDTNGNLFIDGTLNPPSDRNVKQDFAPVDAIAVLEKVAALPVQTWAYKHSTDTRHLGPVAQDFHATFGLGASDTSIASVDADGVALAAIQGLNEKLEARNSKSEARIQQLETENLELKARLEKLEQLVERQLNGDTQ